MENGLADGLRFRRIPRQAFSNCFKLDPMLDENLEQWPHLSELVQSYETDLVKDDYKYGHYESICPITFYNQIFEGPDTDMETEVDLSNAKRNRQEVEMPSTSGSHFSGANFCDSSSAEIPKHFGESSLPAYEPVFDWENERSTIFGQRIPGSNVLQHISGLKISVKVLSLSFQAGLFESFYGTICLYNRERREKLSEDFIFHMLPGELKDKERSVEAHGIFHLDAPSASVCLLIQLEKPATEEGGVTSSVYSRKEPIHLTEREKQKLQMWTRVMPYRESFAWAIIPLFDSGVASASGGSASPSSPLTTSMVGSNSKEGAAEPVAKITVDGKPGYSSGNSVVVEVSNLNKVKEGYTEDSLLDPKLKVHKPVRGILTLEIEKLQAGLVDSEKFVDNRTMSCDTAGLQNSLFSRSFSKPPGYGIDDLQNFYLESQFSERKMLDRNGSVTHGFTNDTSNYFQTFDFRTTLRSEPFSQLFHCLYVYPLSVSMSRKRNLFIRVELRKDDEDIRKPPLEAIHSREPGATIQNHVHTQVSVGARIACYHDEIKVSLPAIWSPTHHLLFTFFHVDLQTKLEGPKPVVIGYASLPLSTHVQLKSDISLPLMKDLLPHYLQDGTREKVDFLEDGKNIFRLKLRLCSSLYPISERIRDFFLEYDRHIIRTSPPWGSELLEAINSLKNVDSTALLQFLHPMLNMLLHLIGSGGETLQVHLR